MGYHRLKGGLVSDVEAGERFGRGIGSRPLHIQCYSGVRAGGDRKFGVRSTGWP